MTNYATQKISVNNFDVAILCHVKSDHVIGGMVRKGQIAEQEATPMAIEGPGSKLIAQMGKLTEIITFAVNNQKLVKGNNLLIVGDNNLAAKVRTIVKYAADTELETIVDGLTASLSSRGLEIRAEYQQALTDFAGLIVGLLTAGIKIAAHDIYTYPIDRIVMTTDTEAVMPEELIGSKVEVKNGDFTDERLQDWSIALDRINGTFTIVGANGHYGLKLDYLSDKKQLLTNCFRTMCERMPKIQLEEAASFNDI